MARILALDPRAPAPDRLLALRRHLDRGAVAALPTDTIYGLAAHALRSDAVARVFELKGRSFGKPLPLVVRDLAQVEEIAGTVPPLFYRLAAAFWPGPLTLIVPAGPRLPAALTAGTGAVGVRQPNSPLLQALLRDTGYPLTATSANRSGQPECLTAAAVETQFGDRLELLVDGGPAPGTLPSTLVDLSGGSPRLLRIGAVPAVDLEPFW